MSAGKPAFLCLCGGPGGDDPLDRRCLWFSLHTIYSVPLPRIIWRKKTLTAILHCCFLIRKGIMHILPLAFLDCPPALSFAWAVEHIPFGNAGLWHSERDPRTRIYAPTRAPTQGPGGSMEYSPSLPILVLWFINRISLGPTPNRGSSIEPHFYTPDRDSWHLMRLQTHVHPCARSL
jgi:hypothetical protein